MKINKKFVVLLIVSLFTINMAGCKFIDKTDNSNIKKIEQSKSYTEKEIKKEARTSIKSSINEYLNIAKELMWEKNVTSENLKNELNAFNKISNKMNYEYERFKHISNNSDSSKGKELATNASKIFENMKQSVDVFIEGVKDIDTMDYSKLIQHFMDSVKSTFDYYKSMI
ncbi:hypothetical protein [[Clostridium] dakarense]|uniref:hypothetical protein n=1 Tax=Faecalimicrobium dakarense TaxID=1301100 RepID=UPI0004B9DB8A|nr:hypothetical protein [[Clostridium] dakarense]